MFEIILSIIFAYFINNFLKQPKKLFSLLFKNIKRKNINNNKEVKFKYTNVELSRLRMSRILIKELIRFNFLYLEDIFKSSSILKKKFSLALENYLLFKYNKTDLKEINMKLDMLLNNSLDYWLEITRTIGEDIYKKKYSKV